MTRLIDRHNGAELYQGKAGNDYSFILRMRNGPQSCYSIRFDGHKIANNRDSFNLLKSAPSTYHRVEAIPQSRLNAKGQINDRITA
jgi:hypothetical protein